MVKPFFLLTCASDISEFGGGVSKAAVSIHDAVCNNEGGGFIVYDKTVQQHNKIKCNAKARLGFSDISSSMDEVVHIHGLWTPFEIKAYRYAKKRGAKLVISPHGMLEPWALKHKWFKKRLAWFLYQKRMLKQADVIVVNSPLEYNTVRTLGFKNPIAIIPNGVDFPGEYEEDRERIVLYLSRISPVKGLSDLLDAWGGIKDKHGYELHICGNVDPGFESSFNTMKAKVLEDPTIRFLGPLFGEKKWRKYSSSSLFVLPSYSENFGIVVAEAMMSGLPVITTTSTPWGIIQEKGLGWIVANDPKKLSTALNEALSLSEDKLRLKGEAAAFFAGNNFRWDKVSGMYKVLYSWVVSRDNQQPDFLHLE